MRGSGIGPFAAREIRPLGIDPPHGAQRLEQRTPVDPALVHLHPLRPHLGGERLVRPVPRHQYRPIQRQRRAHAAALLHEAAAAPYELRSRHQFDELGLPEDLSPPPHPRALPASGRGAASNPESYRYLAEASGAGADQQTLGQWIRGAGFTRVAHRDRTFGAVALNRGRKPTEQTRRMRIVQRPDETGATA